MIIISKDTRNSIIDYFTTKCDTSVFSSKSLGIMMRSFHMSFPVCCLILFIFAPKPIVLFTMVLLIIILFMFFAFNGCILSMIENKVCKDDFTIADPFLELIGWDKNKNNSFNITLIVGLLYYITIGITYYIRFIG